MKAPQRTVLLLLDRRGSNLIRKRLITAQYGVVETFTTDHAVAVCANNPVDAVILDQDLFIETGGWSVAQSLKAVKAHLCVLLVTNAERVAKKLPKGVDAMIDRDPEAVLVELNRLLRRR